MKKKMMQQYVKELEQEPFEPEEFVERLAWRTVNDTVKDGITGFFDPLLIHETFLHAIKDLQILEIRQQKKSKFLEASVKDAEIKSATDLLTLQEKNKKAIDLFHQLDERINLVANKVLHLGDQLESVNIPRARAVEAQNLMRHFSEFLIPGPVIDPLFVDKSSLYEAAAVIQKLYIIAQELPTEKFHDAKKKIFMKYDEIERSLIEEFVNAQNAEDIALMKKLATMLSHFKGYSQCIDAFIEQSQNSFSVKNIFHEILPMCLKNQKLIKQVFSNSEQVMAKFVLNIYHLRIQKHIIAELSDRSDMEKYLQNIYDLYLQIAKLGGDLKQFDMGTDDTYLTKLTKNIFQKYLDTYIILEIKSLKEESVKLLDKYYESKSHQKKQLQCGGFQELKRDIQAVLSTRTNINFAQIEDYGGETFLSEELAIALLQRSKTALQRCTLLSFAVEIPKNAAKIFETVLQYLIDEHVDYALELAVHNVPIPESRSQPEIYFFTVVWHCNVIIRLLEEHFSGDLVPLILSTISYTDCIAKKKIALENIKSKIDVGLDRSINAIIGWVKIYLQAEQRKTDFKPEMEMVDTLNTPACLTVVQYVSNMIKYIKIKLDGKSLENVMYELGTRFHRVIYEHLQQYQFNSAGAMCAICDMNEYRKCIKELNIPLVSNLFDTLHALCNLLLVKPENLKQVCSGDQLAMIDQSILSTFIQLRTDYKTQKLSYSFKGFTA